LSLEVQALPSSHGVSSILLTLEHPVMVLQLSTVQSLLSLHVTGPPGLQLPAWHASPWVQTLLSVHGRLSATDGCSHAPAMLQASMVQTLPSSVHGEPAGLKPSGGQTVSLQASARSHSPVDGRHTVLAGAPRAKSHFPATHRSCVQMLVSTHPPQSAPPTPHRAADWLAKGTQVPRSSQPVQQLPPMHEPPGQLAPSPRGTLEQAPAAQLSVVHGLLSLQFLHWSPPVPHCVTLLPPKQAPLPQQSPEP
jgi:hypothetical protein